MSTLQQEVTHAIYLAHQAPTPMERTTAAQHLAQLVNPNNAHEISDGTIHEMEGLLDSPQDSIRYWTARALGNLGYRGKSAVPKLLELLPKADCLNGSKTSASGIRFALTQFGVVPPPPANCN
jgi:hypothetical protein